MSLLAKVDADLKAAMKEGNTLKVSTLRMLKAEAMNTAIRRTKSTLEEPEVIEVIQKLMKQRQESMEAFRKGGRADLAEKETKEGEFLRVYLPPVLGDEELRGIIQAAIQQAGASGPQAMGAVMKVVLPQVKGRADGKRVSELVNQELGKS